jgi:hypothetical protein
MHRWIAGKIAEILGNEDDVVIELCFNLVEGERFVRQSEAAGIDCSLCSRFVPARHQEDADSAHRISRERHSGILQGAMEVMPERSVKSSRRPKGIA